MHPLTSLRPPRIPGLPSLRNLLAPHGPSRLARQRSLHNQASTHKLHSTLSHNTPAYTTGRLLTTTTTTTSNLLTQQRQHHHPQAIFFPPTPHAKRPFGDLKATGGKAEADLLVEELQELYEVATDEFEIATDSTDAATIYAASDRESARDALNQLCAVYGMYSSAPSTSSSSSSSPSSAANPHTVVTEGQAEAEGSGEGPPFVETNYDPAQVSQAVRDEVRKRVGQRVRELKNAVEVLEEKAKAD
ncbi:hypothetical protein NUU61_007764 [Penicillium alfredii]|uniref:Uncharacterized protein n=1 Tax=Penicillium alfredii TaxID=1506179 RepID=A0A9W9ER50_9EURO|nr:uncharacterized protein NUU61_007764 [Penicillium alfredii]KAJ5086457.1 hypothetical protein NUU61_007764 [Penicillium alfredii]